MALPEPPGDKGRGILDALNLAAPNSVKDIQSTLLVDEGVQVLDLPAFEHAPVQGLQLCFG